MVSWVRDGERWQQETGAESRCPREPGKAGPARGKLNSAQIQSTTHWVVQQIQAALPWLDIVFRNQTGTITVLTDLICILAGETDNVQANKIICVAVLEKSWEQSMGKTTTGDANSRGFWLTTGWRGGSVSERMTAKWEPRDSLGGESSGKVIMCQRHIWRDVEKNSSITKDGGRHLWGGVPNLENDGK